MAQPPVAPEDIWRAFNTPGNRLSGPYQPDKVDIIALQRWLIDNLNALGAAAGFDPSVLNQVRDGLVAEVARAKAEEGRISGAIDTERTARQALSNSYNALVANAPEELNTLFEIAARIVAAELAVSAEAKARADDDGALRLRDEFSLLDGLGRQGRDRPVRTRYRFVNPGTTLGYPKNTCTIWGDDRTLPVFGIIGQSLAEGGAAGAPLATTALYPGRALMPDVGLFPDFGASGFQPLREGVGRFPYESMASGFTSHYLRDLDTLIPGNNLRVGVFNAAIGGEGYSNLKAGSLSDTRYMQSLQGMVEAARRQFGARVIVPANFWMGGEDETLKLLGPKYARMMDQLQRDKQAEIQRITGQTEPVLLMILQPAFTMTTQTAKLGQLVQKGITEAAARNPYIRIIGPHYQYEINNLDGIHHTSVATNYIGMSAARAAVAEFHQSGWTPLEPLEPYFFGTISDGVSRIIQPVNVPVEPLRIDTAGRITLAGSAAAPGYGFHIFDPSGTEIPVSALTILNATTTNNTIPTLAIDFPTTAAPSVLLTYAQVRNGVTDPPGTTDGPVQGARGAIFDSAKQINMYDLTEHSNYMLAYSKRVICNPGIGAASF